MTRDRCRKSQEDCCEQHDHAERPQVDRAGFGSRRRRPFALDFAKRTPAKHPKGKGSTQVFHHTPHVVFEETPDRRGGRWNWFHTLSEQKASVKSESVKPLCKNDFVTSYSEAPAGPRVTLFTAGALMCAKLAQVTKIEGLAPQTEGEAQRRREPQLRWKQFQKKRPFAR